MLNTSDISLYRMVHWQNVAYILQHGMCCRGHELEDPNYITIGMRSLIADRHDYPVPLENAGNLGEYVPFYFAGHSPMLFLIKKGYSGVEQRPQEDIVFFMCKFEAIKQAGLPFVFTDRNAKIAVASYYRDEADFGKLNWEIIGAHDWANDENKLDRRDLKQAEFLVHRHVPVSCIHALVVKTKERKVYFDNLIRNLGLEIKVYVDEKRKLYY
nr:DUF4433 domain-containing protein [uncultured Fluviicola sp.]